MSRTTYFIKRKQRPTPNTKKSAFNVSGNLVIVVKFTLQIVFGNSRQNPRHANARGREESLSNCILSFDLICEHKNKGF